MFMLGNISDTHTQMIFTHKSKNSSDLVFREFSQILQLMIISSNENILHDKLFVRGIHPSPVDSPHKGQWHKALMFSLMFALTNDWINSGVAGDLSTDDVHVTSL